MKFIPHIILTSFVYIFLNEYFLSENRTTYILLNHSLTGVLTILSPRYLFIFCVLILSNIPPSLADEIGLCKFSEFFQLFITFLILSLSSLSNILIYICLTSFHDLSLIKSGLCSKFKYPLTTISIVNILSNIIIQKKY